VDLGFGMKAGTTGVKAADNAAGYYCGACHDGRRTFDGGKPVFGACAKRPPGPACERCHGERSGAPAAFAASTKDLPRGRLGNGVDWEQAELDGRVRPADFLAGVSIERKPLTAGKDFLLSPKIDSMPEILFSHAKHTRWNGCELCHPEIFVGVKKGATKYSMAEIFEGKYCGACHQAVAFPLTDCQRCHTRPVQ
jgi:c(7)-type cytochrome triheme protein